MGLRFSADADVPSLTARLESYAAAHPGRFNVYNASTMPERWAYRGEYREKQASLCPYTCHTPIPWISSTAAGHSYPLALKRACKLTP